MRHSQTTSFERKRASRTFADIKKDVATYWRYCLNRGSQLPVESDEAASEYAPDSYTPMVFEKGWDFQQPYEQADCGTPTPWYRYVQIDAFNRGFLHWRYGPSWNRVETRPNEVQLGMAVREVITPLRKSTRRPAKTHHPDGSVDRMAKRSFYFFWNRGKYSD